MARKIILEAILWLTGMVLGESDPHSDWASVLMV